MFEEFSAGYYLGRMYVEPAEVEHALMHREDHERVNQQVYAADEGIERLDAPLVMKLDECHFPVHGAASIPAGTLALPEALLEATRVDDPPALREVLLAKADQAAQLLRWLAPVIDPAGLGPDGDGSAPE